MQGMKRFELIDGEKIVFEDTTHWKNYIFPLAGMFLSFVVFILRMRFPDVNVFALFTQKVNVNPAAQRCLSGAEGLILIIFMASMFVRCIQVTYTRYYVTTKRIIAISGILRVYYQEMLLKRCEMVYLNQSFYERLFSSGDILCVSAGSNLYLDDVRRAQMFKQTILTMLVKMKEENDGE